MWNDKKRKIIEAQHKAGICCFKDENKESEKLIRKYLGGQCANCGKLPGAIIKCPYREIKKRECKHTTKELLRETCNSYTGIINEHWMCMECGYEFEQFKTPSFRFKNI